jgi:hypothetical protein
MGSGLAARAAPRNDEILVPVTLPPARLLSIKMPKAIAKPDYVIENNSGLLARNGCAAGAINSRSPHRRHVDAPFGMP